MRVYIAAGLIAIGVLGVMPQVPPAWKVAVGSRNWPFHPADHGSTQPNVFPTERVRPPT